MEILQWLETLSTKILSNKPQVLINISEVSLIKITVVTHTKKAFYFKGHAIKHIK